MMVLTRALAVALALLFACGDRVHELDEDQGPCDGVAHDACVADSRCQQAYVFSPFPPVFGEPAVSVCLLVEPPLSPAAPCRELGYEACRAGNGCSPAYWQRLGPTDGVEGEPYFLCCLPEDVELERGRDPFETFEMCMP